MNNSFQVKKEASSGSNDSLEALNLTMQRMELNVLKVVGTLSDRVNAMENKLDSLLLNVNNLERNTSNTLASTVNGLASHLEKAHVANYEKQLSHIAEVQTLTQIITALRQNPNAFGPVPGVPLPVMQQQQQQSTFRPVHPNLQAAPSIPQNVQPPPQHIPMEPKPVGIPTENRPPQAPVESKPPFSVIKPPTAPETSNTKDAEQGFKPSPFAANAGGFSFGGGQPQKPLFPGKPALPTAASESPAQPTETKSIFGNTAKTTTFSFANPAANANSPFASATTQPAASPAANQQKPLFASPFAPAANKPLSFTPVASGNTDNSSSPFGKKDNEEESENPEEYVPDAHYEPVIPLPDKVEVVTGEESEEVLFKNRAKLYIFNSDTKEVKERGVGDIKVLYNREKKTYRVVMRREQVHKICANFRISKGMSIGDKTGTKNCGIFNCVDFSENNEAGVPTVFIIRFREDSVYDEFKKLFNNIAEGKNVEGTSEAAKPSKEAQPAPPETKKVPATKPQQGFGDKFNKKEGEWDCQICYVRNKPTDNACLSCGTGKDGKEAKPSEAAFKPTTFSSPANAQFSFGINKPAPSFGFTPNATPAAPKTEASSTDSKPAETKSLFGPSKPITFSFAPPQTAATTSPFANASAFGGKSATDGTQPKSLFGGSTTSSANKTPLSFSSFASGTSFLDKKPNDSPNNSFGAQKSSTFGKSEEGKKDNEEESENPEEYVPDAHYEPVVPLPDKVEVVTGEESEEVLFKNRAKLYIFNSDTKEVKERGVGDIKVLYNREKKTYRVVMRREQVHKICANFRITNGMSIADKPGLKNCGIFNCVDFSENATTGSSAVFYVRFREDSVYEEFKKLFTDIAEGKHTPTASTAAESTSNVTATTARNNLPQSTATVPSLPYIGGDSHNPSVDADEAEEEYDEDYGEDYGEENYDEESEVLFETDCKLTLAEAYQSPLNKNRSEETHEKVKLVVSVADEGVYQVEFDSGKAETIFPHYIQNDSDYKKDGKKITFIARDHNAVRKSVTCEFKDAAAAEKAFETLQECRDSTAFQGFDD